MQIRPVGTGNIPFPYNKKVRVIKKEDMVPEEKGDESILPPKLTNSVIIVIPKGEKNE